MTISTSGILEQLQKFSFRHTKNKRVKYLKIEIYIRYYLKEKLRIRKNTWKYL